MIGAHRTLAGVTVLLAMLGATSCAPPAPLLPSPFTSPQSPSPVHYDSIHEGDLNRALSEGPGRFLQRVRVLPVRRNQNFVGWRIVELFPGEPVRVDRIRVGDVVVRVNGHRIIRPEQFMEVWQTLVATDAITLDVLRGGQPLQVRIPVMRAQKKGDAEAPPSDSKSLAPRAEPVAP